MRFKLSTNPQMVWSLVVTLEIVERRNTCSLGVEVSQDLLGRFSQSLHDMVGIELQMINLTFFYDILRDIAMATNFVSFRTCSLGAEVSQDPLD